MSKAEAFVRRLNGERAKPLKQFFLYGLPVSVSPCCQGFAFSIEVRIPSLGAAVVCSDGRRPELCAVWLKEFLKEHLADQCVIRNGKWRFQSRSFAEAGSNKPNRGLHLKAKSYLPDVMQGREGGGTGGEQRAYGGGVARR